MEVTAQTNNIHVYLTDIMSKGRESFGKRERQKKKLQKKKDKEQRKEERKADPGSKPSFDDMIAYVDENGNLSSTPPDPSKRKEIKAEHIDISVAPTAHIPKDAVRQGRVKFFNESKGFGFISDDQTGEDIFVHANSLHQPVKENDKVTYKTERGFKGLSAIDVELVS